MTIIQIFVGVGSDEAIDMLIRMVQLRTETERRQKSPNFLGQIQANSPHSGQHLPAALSILFYSKPNPNSKPKSLLTPPLTFLNPNPNPN